MTQSSERKEGDCGDNFMLKVSAILADVHAGKFGTTNRSELISRLQSLIEKP